MPEDTAGAPASAPSGVPLPPPLRPGDDRRGRIGRWIARGCVVYVLVALLVSAAAIVLPGTSWDPFRPRVNRRFSCQNNLQQLAGLYVESSGWPPVAPARSGTALLLGWRKDGTKIRRGQESVLICPGDNWIAAPDTPEAVARYDDVDLDAPPDDLCSYAVRDFGRFPLDPSSSELEPVAACAGRFRDGTWSACHKGGIVVAFCDGSSRFLEWSEIGLGSAGSGPSSPPMVGPESPTPMLRVLCYRPGETVRAWR